MKVFISVLISVLLCVFIYRLAHLFLSTINFTARRALHKVTTKKISVDDFFKLKEKVTPGWEFSGVYILHNYTKKMYYVGQSIRVVQRVSAHFSGRGNGDVYADYKYGDKFTITIIPLKDSGYSTLNSLEKAMIEKYKANTTGYNKTSGNN